MFVCLTYFFLWTRVEWCCVVEVLTWGVDVKALAVEVFLKLAWVCLACLKLGVSVYGLTPRLLEELLHLGDEEIAVGP